MNAPKLRFNDFNDEWTEKTLNNLVDLQGGNAFSSNDSVIDGAKWLKIANVSFGKITWDTIDYLPLDFLNKYTKYLLQSGDLVLTLTRPIIRKELKIARLNENDTPALLNQRVAKLVINTNLVNQNFLYQLLRNRKTVLQIESAISGTDPPNLGNKELKKIKVFIPSLNEGYIVGSFINLIDMKIQKQQEKIVLLEGQKKGLMQKVFSQQIRFKDEDGGEFPEWEEKEMGEIGSFFKGTGLSKADLSLEGRPCVLYGQLYTTYGYVIDKVLSYCSLEMKSFIGQANDVLIPASGETAWDIACASALNIDDVALGGDLNVFRPNKGIEGSFISYQINSLKKYELSKLAQGASVVHLYSNSLKKLKLVTPIYKEQKKIANFFLNIDIKIEKEKVKLKLLNGQKKGFMQRMFV